MKRSQKGFTLVELMLVTGLAMSMVLLSFYSKEAEIEQAKASQVGAQLFQYGNAVRTYLSQNSSPSVGSKIGSAWLKNATCGGTFAVGKEFLPCDFPAATVSDPIKFGQLSFSTLIESAGTAPSIKNTATVTTSAFATLTGGKSTVRSDLSGISALAAASAVNSGLYGTQSEEGSSVVNATTQVSYKSSALDGKITIIASSTPDNDVWIRTDGTNAMGAVLNFDSTTVGNRQIQGLSRIQNLAAQVLTLGNPSGIAQASGAGVLFDANSEVIGTARVRNTLTVDNGAAITGNVSATGNAAANQNVTAGGTVTAGQNVTAGGNVTANGNIQANSAALAQIFYDSNNTNYYFDPNNTSNLNALQSQVINNSGAITSGGRIHTNEFFEVGVTANEGAGCPQNGFVAHSPSGQVLSCSSGVWSAGGIKGEYVSSGSYTGTAFLSSGSKAQLVMVSGGSGSVCEVWDGINRFNIRAVVQGMIVGNVEDDNNEYAKTGFISFNVPANTSYTVSSAPYNCNAGTFSVFAFNL
jgi:type II secretory pathway pseudopilin PulG